MPWSFLGGHFKVVAFTDKERYIEPLNIRKTNICKSKGAAKLLKVWYVKPHVDILNTLKVSCTDLVRDRVSSWWMAFELIFASHYPFLLLLTICCHAAEMHQICEVLCVQSVMILLLTGNNRLAVLKSIFVWAAVTRMWQAMLFLASDRHIPQNSLHVTTVWKVESTRPSMVHSF